MCSPSSDLVGEADLQLVNISEVPWDLQELGSVTISGIQILSYGDSAKRGCVTTNEKLRSYLMYFERPSKMGNCWDFFSFTKGF